MICDEQTIKFCVEDDLITSKNVLEHYIPNLNDDCLDCKLKHDDIEKSNQTALFKSLTFLALRGHVPLYILKM